MSNIIKILEQKLAEEQALFAVPNSAEDSIKSAYAINIYEDIINMLKQPQRNLPCQQTCRKCGSSNVNYRYRVEGERLDPDWLEFEHADKELIRCTCRACGFRWNVDTLDNIKQQQIELRMKLFSAI